MRWKRWRATLRGRSGGLGYCHGPAGILLRRREGSQHRRGDRAACRIVDARAIVVGAHYDSGAGAPGANDNGSGVAAVLELARLLKRSASARHASAFVWSSSSTRSRPTSRPRTWAACTTPRAERSASEKVVGMYSLETIGFYSREPGKQQYPLPFDLILPNAATSSRSSASPGSRGLLDRVVGSFRSHTAFPDRSAALRPTIVPGIDWSDHWSFEQFGLPGHHGHRHRAISAIRIITSPPTRPTRSTPKAGARGERDGAGHPRRGQKSLIPEKWTPVFGKVHAQAKS